MQNKDFEYEKCIGSVRMKSVLWGKNKSKVESVQLLKKEIVVEGTNF